MVDQGDLVSGDVEEKKEKVACFSLHFTLEKDVKAEEGEVEEDEEEGEEGKTLAVDERDTVGGLEGEVDGVEEGVEGEEGLLVDLVCDHAKVVEDGGVGGEDGLAEDGGETEDEGEVTVEDGEGGEGLVRERLWGCGR